MSLLYRTGKIWHDPAEEGVLHSYGVDGDRLIVLLFTDAMILAHKDESIAMRSEWQCGGERYSVSMTQAMPARGLLRVEAARVIRCDVER